MSKLLERVVLGGEGEIKRLSFLSPKIVGGCQSIGHVDGVGQVESCGCHRCQLGPSVGVWWSA